MYPTVLGCVFPEADSETRIGVQVGYLQGDLGRGMGTWDKEEKPAHRQEALLSLLPQGDPGETAESPLECCTIIPICCSGWVLLLTAWIAQYLPPTMCTSRTCSCSRSKSQKPLAFITGSVGVRLWGIRGITYTLFCNLWTLDMKSYHRLCPLIKKGQGSMTHLYPLRKKEGLSSPKKPHPAFPWVARPPPVILVSHPWARPLIHIMVITCR